VLASDLMFHFLLTVIITALVATFVLWRYRVAVLQGMSSAVGENVPIGTHARTSVPASSSGSDAAVLAWERAVHRRAIGAWLLSVAVPAPLIAFAYLTGEQISVATLVSTSAVVLGAAVPMIAVSLGWTWKRGALFWLYLLLAGAAATVVTSMLQRIARGASPTIDQLLNIVVFFQLAAVLSSLPLLLLLASGSGKLRAVAPITFAGLLVFGLAPVLGIRAEQLLAQSRAGSEFLLATISTFHLHAAFVVLALPTGWIAWKRLQTMGQRYAAKRFSDVQLLARAWWLMFIAAFVVEILAAKRGTLWPLVTCAAAYPLFVAVNRYAFRPVRAASETRPPRTLLLLRVFGHTARTEKLYDRIGARWRYFGPITMIAAPDVVARSIDPAEFLQYMLGSVEESFVRSAADLERRLQTLDMDRDPDGRFRVGDFCCADTTWRATVTALMDRADVVLMDLRGITSQQRGCEFELRELPARLRPQRIVLVVDSATDRAFVRAALGHAADAVQLYEMDKLRPAATDTLFRDLVRAAG